jgi:hypothetical protein
MKINPKRNEIVKRLVLLFLILGLLSLFISCDMSMEPIDLSGLEGFVERWDDHGDMGGYQGPPYPNNNNQQTTLVESDSCSQIMIAESE